MYAQEEARLLDHNYIGTEHVLLGLIRDGEAVGAKVLEALDISLDAVRTEVLRIVGRSSAAPWGLIPFTPAAKSALEFSLREALQLGHNYIGTEHMLLGLIREGEGVGAEVLHRLGADLDGARQQVIQLLSGYGSSERAPGSEAADSSAPFPDPLDLRLSAIEQVLRPLPELLAGIARSLDALAAGVEAVERRMGGEAEETRSAS